MTARARTHVPPLCPPCVCVCSGTRARGSRPQRRPSRCVSPPHFPIKSNLKIQIIPPFIATALYSQSSMPSLTCSLGPTSIHCPPSPPPTPFPPPLPPILTSSFAVSTLCKQGDAGGALAAALRRQLQLEEGGPRHVSPATSSPELSASGGLSPHASLPHGSMSACPPTVSLLTPTTPAFRPGQMHRQSALAELAGESCHLPPPPHKHKMDGAKHLPPSLNPKRDRPSEYTLWNVDVRRRRRCWGVEKGHGGGM